MHTPWRLTRLDTGATIVSRLAVADNMWTRFWGLQFRAPLPAGAGLLLVPCPSVHTFFLRSAIDVVLIDRRGTVVATRSSVRPWRMVMPVSGSYATLELPGGTCNLEVGTSLRLRAPDGSTPAPSRSLQFLLG